MSDCQIWTGPIGTAGYGVISRSGIIQRAHRVAYELYVGPIPKGLVVRHLCNVKACVNPDHLAVGTQAENVNDAAAIGRMSRYGESGPKAKLTSEQVMEIRRLHSSGVGKLEISKRYKVTRRNISYIVNGKTRVYA